MCSEKRVGAKTLGYRDWRGGARKSGEINRIEPLLFRAHVLALPEMILFSSTCLRVRNIVYRLILVLIKLVQNGYPLLC